MHELQLAALIVGKGRRSKLLNFFSGRRLTGPVVNVASKSIKVAPASPMEANNIPIVHLERKWSPSLYSVWTNGSLVGVDAQGTKHCVAAYVADVATEANHVLGREIQYNCRRSASAATMLLTSHRLPIVIVHHLDRIDGIPIPNNDLFHSIVNC